MSAQPAGTATTARSTASAARPPAVRSAGGAGRRVAHQCIALGRCSSAAGDGRCRCRRIGRGADCGTGICAAEKLSDEAVGEVVVAFADRDVAKGSLGIDQVLGRPVAVVIGVPRRVVVV